MVYLNRKELGWRILRIRRRTGMNQKEFAREIGVDVTTVSRYERGHSFPNAETILNICLIGGCSADYLLGHKKHEER